MSEKLFRVDKIREIAERVASGDYGDFISCLEDGKIYTYENGYWRNLLPNEFLSIIENRIIDKIKVKIKNSDPVQYEEVEFKTVTRFASSRKKSIIEEFRLLKFKKLSEFNSLPMINLQNFMLEPNQNTAVNHNKDYFSTIQLPYKYNITSLCPLWEKTLGEIFEEDTNKILALQEFFGHCLTRNTKIEKALLLLGESRSGKSTLLNTLQYMVGDKNCSHIALENLNNQQFTSMMINKLVNIDGEVSKKAEAYEAQFKQIVTGHEVKSNDKFLQPFDFRPYCKFVMAANEFPRITDHSSAFYNRLILIPCDRVFEEKEQNRNLRDDLLEELPGILNWALAGLKRLNKRGHFEQYNFLKEAVKELEDENNPVNLFFNQHLEVCIDESIYIEKPELFSRYQQWAKQNQQYNLSHVQFSRCMFKKFGKVTPRDARLTGNGSRIWRNIRYIQFKNDNQQEIEIPAETVSPHTPLAIEAGGKQGDINWGD